MLTIFTFAFPCRAYFFFFFQVIKDKDLDAGAILDYVIQDAKTFRDPVMRSDFVLFAKRLSMANQLKIFFRFEPWCVLSPYTSIF